MSRIGVFLAAFCLIVTPYLAFGAGLVPCGGPGEPVCQSCHVVELVNRVVTWLVMILGTIAAIIIVYAGFKLVTSGGSSHAKEDAKELIQNMFLGYVIVLAGWLLIDTGMKMLLVDGETALGVWNQVECVAQRNSQGGIDLGGPEQVGIEVEEVQMTAGEGVNTGNRQYLQCSELPNGQYNCTAQQDQCRRGGGSPTVDTSSSRLAVVCMYYGGGSNTGGSTGGGARPPDLSAGGACNPSIIARHFPQALVGSAQCIIRAESSCGARMVSVSDVMRSDPQRRAFSFGPMQINLTVHTLNGCAGYPPVLRCLDAFSGKNYSARVVNEGLYQQCARAAQNIDCNIKNGFRIYREAGNRWSPWSTASACGL